MFEEEERSKPPMKHDVGMDLSSVSIDELKERITLLQAEILRLETEIISKDSSLKSAENIFRNLE